MPQFSYIPYSDEKISLFPNGKVEEYQEKKVIGFDSMTISSTEKDLVRNSGNWFYCYSCDTEMYFIPGKVKNSRFAHKKRKHCFQADSLAHSSTKKALFWLFYKEKYEVRTEKRFKTKHFAPIADVAVRTKTEQDVLVVEVQANPTINCASIAQRTNAYSSQGIPTAWIIVLDSFFENDVDGKAQYTGTFETEYIKNEDGTITTIEKELPFGKETIFTYFGSRKKNFTLIMDTYHYVIVVNHAGHFHLIRRDPSVLVDKVESELKGKQWNPENDIFLISLIPQENVVKTLLETQIRLIDYKPKKQDPLEKGELFLGDEGIHATDDIDEIEFKGYSIDFDRANQLEKERLLSEKSLDSLQLINEQFAAIKEAYEKIEEERKRKVLEELKHQEDKKRAEEEAYEKIEEERKRNVIEDLKIQEDKKREEQEALGELQVQDLLDKREEKNRLVYEPLLHKYYQRFNQEREFFSKQKDIINSFIHELRLKNLSLVKKLEEEDYKKQNAKRIIREEKERQLKILEERQRKKREDKQTIKDVQVLCLLEIIEKMEEECVPLTKYIKEIELKNKRTLLEMSVYELESTLYELEQRFNETKRKDPLEQTAFTKHYESKYPSSYTPAKQISLFDF